MNRAVRKFSRPVRAVILAVLVHVAFGLLLGLSLSFKPQVIKPSIAKPVKAIVIDRSTITQEETNKKKAEQKRKQEAEKKRKQEAEKKRKKEAEKKRKQEVEKKRKKVAEKKRKQEAEKKRKKEAEKKRKAEAAREQEKQDAYSALGSLVGAIKGKIEGNWSNRLACSGQEVTISVKVNVSGEVTAVKVVGDSGDDACRRSAENAVYKASPLPFPDNPRFFKWLDQENRGKVLNLVNFWFEQGVFPQDKLKAYVASLYKKGDPKKQENYCPISLLNSIYKIYAGMLQARLAT